MNGARRLEKYMYFLILLINLMCFIFAVLITATTCGHLQKVLWTAAESKIAQVWKSYNRQVYFNTKTSSLPTSLGSISLKV